MFIVTVIYVLFATNPSLHGARILGMFPIWARSHHRFLQPVVRVLAEAGHEVVVYSPFPLQNPPSNYTDVLLKNIKTESEELTQFFLLISKLPHYQCFDAAYYIYENMYREFVGDPRIKELLTSKEKFDLIISETFCAQEYTLMLAHKFKVPVIALQAFPTNHVINSQAGNSLSLTFSPTVCAPYSDQMSFIQRLINSLSSVRELYNYYSYQLKSLDNMMKQDFPDLPSLEELSKSVALIFVNDHLTADYAFPRTPNIIPVGGIHIQPPQPLPQDIKKFADGAKDGLIFFSLGTYVQDELQPQQYFNMYINVFRGLKQRVIWKTRKENIEGIPENVMTMSWAPQQDILAHPNTVLFITHGGLHSQHEAVYFGVPVIGIPQFFDQHRNVRYFEDKKVGIKISTEDLSEKSISTAIHSIVTNTSYRDNMKRLSAIFKDRPLSPAESVVFWTEYVLRHGGAAHLRPASIELRWYQLIALDVMSLSGLVALSITFILYRLFSSFLKVLFKMTKAKSQLDKKQR